MAYVLIRYISTPAHSACGGRCPGGQGGNGWKSLSVSGFPNAPPRYHQLTRVYTIILETFWSKGQSKLEIPAVAAHHARPNPSIPYHNT